jgi:hypothetical protein
MFSYKHNNVLSFFAESASESVQKKFESPKMELKRYLNLDVWIDDPIIYCFGIKIDKNFREFQL